MIRIKTIINKVQVVTLSRLDIKAPNEWLTIPVWTHLSGAMRMGLPDSVTSHSLEAAGAAHLNMCAFIKFNVPQ